MKAPRPLSQSTIIRGFSSAGLTILCKAGTFILPQSPHNGTHGSADGGTGVVQGIAGFDQTLDGASCPFLIRQYGLARVAVWLT